MDAKLKQQKFKAMDLLSCVLWLKSLELVNIQTC